MPDNDDTPPQSSGISSFSRGIGSGLIPHIQKEEQFDSRPRGAGYETLTTNQFHNAFDTEYSCIPKELSTEATVFPFPTHRDMKGIKTSIIWDTGATHSALSPKIAKDLGLNPIDTVIVYGVNSSKVADVVIASISLSNGIFLTERRFSVSEIPGTDVLIGMDIIMLGDFAISNGEGKTRFSFAIPPFKSKISFTEKANAINDRFPEAHSRHTFSKN